MIISHSKKFIFIHNYKVAGTSIREALRPYANAKILTSSLHDNLRVFFGVYPRIYSSNFHNHIKASELKRQIPNKVFDEYYKFGFVRNPWDWQVSLYTYMIKQKKHFQNTLGASFASFDEYIDWRVHEDLHLQKDFFYQDDEFLMDYIGKMETIAEDYTKICEKLSMVSKLPHLNASRDDNKYLKFYSEKSLQLVSQAFAPDIELFGYKEPKLI
jgi:hypothetical protein